MCSNYSNRGNSSVETLNPLHNDRKKFNLVTDNSNARPSQVGSLPSTENSPTTYSNDVFNDSYHLIRSKSNISFTSTDNIEISQFLKLDENSISNARIGLQSENYIVSNNDDPSFTPFFSFPYSKETLLIEGNRNFFESTKLEHNATPERISNTQENLQAKKEAGNLDDLMEGGLQSLSPQDSSLALTTSDYISPIPALAFSPSSNSNRIQKYKLQKVLQELLDSEENYIVSLTLLLNYYIDPLVNKLERCGIPLLIIKCLLLRLIDIHTNMLQHLRLSYQYPQSQICESSITGISIEFAKTVFEVGINLPIYEEYCNIYEDVLKLIKDSENVSCKKKDSNIAWVKGWKNYLEATQPTSKRMDLSFLSLVQKPITRVAKYRLIIESLLKHSYANNDIYMYYNLIKAKLNDLNENSRAFKENDISTKINNFLYFEGTSLGVELSLEFFGKCLMVGSLKIAWIQKNSEKSSTMGIFLYKSHIIISNISPRKIKKHELKFIIPLSICNLFKNPKEADGGLYSKYSYTLKLIFEHEYCQYEILLISITKTEFQVWESSLDLLINHVNGPYTLGYTNTSDDYAKLVILYPQDLVPYDISLLKISNYQKISDYCYFKTPIFINIVIEYPSLHETIENGYVLIDEDNQPNFNIQPCYQAITISINKVERVNAELNLASIWSKELPLIFPTKQENSAKQTMKKSSSWSQLKMGMGSFRGLRTSQSFSEGINSIKNHQQVDDTDQGFCTLERNNSTKLNTMDTFENEKIIGSEISSSEIKRINSKSYKFKNAVLGLFQISRSNSIKAATD